MIINFIIMVILTYLNLNAYKTASSLLVAKTNMTNICFVYPITQKKKRKKQFTWRKKQFKNKKK